MAQPHFNGIDFTNLTAPNTIRPRYGRPKKLSARILKNALLSGKEYEKFLLSNPDIEDDGDNGEWVPVRGLGSGGFGKVVHFARLNDLGEVEDNVAIKQQEMLLTWGNNGMWHRDLTREAFFQSQLSTNDTANCITGLRKYKAYPHDKQTRLYLEYAAHGTLEKLSGKYAFKQKYLPEIFLWRVFEKLAEAALLMRECPGRWDEMFPNAAGNPNDNRRHPHRFLLAMDIKPSNILLFDSAPLDEKSKRLPLVPGVKLTDFGLMRVVNGPVPVDARRILEVGTDGYKPPEVPQPFHPLHLQQSPPLDIGWQNRIFDRSRGVVMVDEKHNIWCAGKVIFDIMTHRDWNFCHREWMQELREENYHFLGHPRYQHFIPEINALQGSERTGDSFSEELRDLVRECLSIDPELRPTSQALLNDIRRYMGDCMNRIKHGGQRGVDPRDQVCLTNAEINSLAQGNDIDLYQLGVPGDPGYWWHLWQDLRANDCLNSDEPLYAPNSVARKEFYDLEESVGPVPGRHWWKEAGDMVQVAPEVDGQGKEQPTRRKRMRSWAEDTESDVYLREKLMGMRNQCQVAEDQPLELFDYVLRKEWMDVPKAVAALQWMFSKRRAVAPDEEWTLDPLIARKAKKLSALALEKNLTRIRGDRMYRYFVAHSTYGNDQVNEAIEEMTTVFRGHVD